jgi:hypothetical protein
MRAAVRVPDDGPQVPLSSQQAIALLESIPGVNQRRAEMVIADVGTDMPRVPPAGHLASWVGICPGHHHRAGKQIRGTTRTGDRWVRHALSEAAQGAMRPTDGAHSGPWWLERTPFSSVPLLFCNVSNPLTTWAVTSLMSESDRPLHGHRSVAWSTVGSR